MAETKIEKKVDTKVYQILSYIGILWLIGLIVPEKNDKDLKFHVGQGMVLTIAGAALSVAVSLVNNLLIFNVFRTSSYWGYTTVSGFGAFLAGLLNFAVWGGMLALVIIGIMNVNKGVKKELPIIGKFAFYK